MDWSANAWQSAFRIELRVQAIEFASRGWPVLAGTYPVGSHWAGHSDYRGQRGYEETHEHQGTQGHTDPVPVDPDWQERSAVRPEEVTAWWANRPYNLLVATGIALDALEVRSSLGQQAASALRSLGFPAPIVATPDDRWYFLTEAGQCSCPDLTASGQVRLHTFGSWIPMPPTTFHHGVVHWRVKPEVCGWRLPPACIVHDALATAMESYQAVADLTGVSG